MWYGTFQVVGVDPHGSILAQPEELNDCDNPIYHVSSKLKTLIEL